MLAHRVDIATSKEGALLQYRTIPNVSAKIIHLEQFSLFISTHRDIGDRFYPVAKDRDRGNACRGSQFSTKIAAYFK